MLIATKFTSGQSENQALEKHWKESNFWNKSQTLAMNKRADNVGSCFEGDPKGDFVSSYAGEASMKASTIFKLE